MIEGVVMQEKWSEWIAYNGDGECPVDKDTVVQVCHIKQGKFTTKSPCLIDWLYVGAYRIKQNKEYKKVVLYGCDTDVGWSMSGEQLHYDTHKITFDAINGEPDCKTIRMEKLY